MQDYEPLDISPSCNAGPEILDSSTADTKPGLKSFRGLPFQIGGLAEILIHRAVAQTETASSFRSARRPNR